LNGNSHAGHYVLGLALLFGGSAREAVPEFEMTARLSPRDPAMWAILGYQALKRDEFRLIRLGIPKSAWF
jgi:hypothetical protein